MNLVTAKELDMHYERKFDVINLQGVFLNFPGVVAAGGRVRQVAGLYLQLLRDVLQRDRSILRTKPARLVRMDLLAKVEQIIVQQREDDWFTVLTA